MEFIGPALGIVAAIAVVIFVLVIIVKLFLNYVISKIISASLSLIALIVAVAAGNDVYNSLIPLLLLTTFSWLFFIGPRVFDVEWDGASYHFDLVSDTRVDMTPKTTGGFLGNAFGALMFFGLSFFIFGEDYPVVFFLMPVALLLINSFT